MKLLGISALNGQDSLSNTQRTNFFPLYTLYTIERSVPSFCFPCKRVLQCLLWVRNPFNKTPIQLLGCDVASGSATGNFPCKTELTSAFSLSHFNHSMTSLRLSLKKCIFFKVHFFLLPACPVLWTTSHSSKPLFWALCFWWLDFCGVLSR